MMQSLVSWRPILMASLMVMMTCVDSFAQENGEPDNEQTDTVQLVVT